MKQTIEILCKNNEQRIAVPVGSTLNEIFPEFHLDMKYGPISAKVNNKVEGMNYRLYHNKTVEFLDMTTPSGSRAYTRTLFFVLCKAVHDLYPGAHVIIDIPVSNGYYINLKLGRPVQKDDIDQIRAKMQQLIDAALPVKRRECTTEEAISLFAGRGASTKVKLLKSIGNLYTTYYEIDGYPDYYYGTLLTNTSQLYLFGLEPYYEGMLLRIPSLKNPAELGEMIQQHKMFDIFQEHHRWQYLMGVSTVGDFNEIVQKGQSTKLINVSEALQEKKISRIAETISERVEEGVKMVLIAGPSSSGKTTFCKRLSIQLMTCGISPVMISLDDYFVDRTRTPLDEKGDYDYESLYALDLPLLNQHLTMLLNGEEVTLPKYNFQTGKSEKDAGKKLQLRPHEVLVVEGIHALNPELTARIPEKMKFRVYISALTTILLDSHNYIPTTDNRLLRRIIRDYKYRGVNAQETIRRWPSVRAGENKWIFPYQENADVMFNTAMLFELAVIREQAIPLLELVPENVPEHAEAHRLLTFLKYIRPVPNKQIPPTSLLREFLGGSSFKY
ncbi:MAG: nucleoside kinase [Prevotella sp.]|nr:nucleoside kinase [Prevotella sp.]